ncbi:M48 family metallopeptidase [Oceanospirillum sanctuarii]|uniref:M48 family metallopeptidase n=1 Tax=Oceanospirillum sanctuarii TaxID=1434821 RepID=UPI000A3A34D1|nr:M48 family metallopeptidase [Oceanospirillum sanctuarii]
MTVSSESNALADAEQHPQDGVQGIFQQAGCAAAQPAFAVVDSDGGVKILSTDQDVLEQHPADALGYSSVIPGLPAELHLPDGARFIPEDVSYRWPGLKPEAHIPGWLETHWIAVFASVVILPFFIWMMIFKVIPAGASIGVALLPDSVAEESGEQTLAILDRFYMEPSDVSEAQQAQIRQQWHQALDALNIPRDNYRLNFRRWNMGANAMALPNGDVILTDDIVELMADRPEQLTAVMLHEIGHVEHQHSMKMMAQATATSMLFALVFGDIEGAGEMVIGASASLLQSAFSRDMEREADAFAYTQLHKLGQSPTDFADAMSSLMHSHGASESDSKDDSSLSNYLSSHPAIHERIEAARNWKPAQ